MKGKTISEGLRYVIRRLKVKYNFSFYQITQLTDRSRNIIKTICENKEDFHIKAILEIESSYKLKVKMIRFMLASQICSTALTYINKITLQQ